MPKTETDDSNKEAATSGAALTSGTPRVTTVTMAGAVFETVIPEFNGDPKGPITANQFFDAVDRAQVLNTSWSAEQVVSAAIGKLSGNAAQFFINKRKSGEIAEGADWAAIKAVLKARFAPLSKAQYEPALRKTLIQAPKEGVADFYDRCESVEWRINDGLTDDERKSAVFKKLFLKNILASFVGGLRADLRKVVQSDRFVGKSNAEILDAAIFHEATSSDQQSNIQVNEVSFENDGWKTVGGATSKSGKGNDPVLGVLPSNMRPPDKVSDEIVDREIVAINKLLTTTFRDERLKGVPTDKALMSLVKVKKTGQGKGRAGASNKGGGGGGANSSGGPKKKQVGLNRREDGLYKCYNCNEWGNHIASECTAKRKERTVKQNAVDVEDEKCPEYFRDGAR